MEAVEWHFFKLIGPKTLLLYQLMHIISAIQRRKKILSKIHTHHYFLKVQVHLKWMKTSEKPSCILASQNCTHLLISRAQFKQHLTQCWTLHTVFWATYGFYFNFSIIILKEGLNYFSKIMESPGAKLACLYWRPRCWAAEIICQGKKKRKHFAFNLHHHLVFWVQETGLKKEVT